MTPLLPPWPLFSAFMVASLVLAITPGPGVIYIVTHSALQGRKAGLASVLGVALGNLANALAAALGLAALFAVSSLAFSIVRYAGAAYLIWLGIRALRSPRAAVAPAATPAAAPIRRVIRDGFVVASLNPKTTLFFAAFLPQFLGSPAGAPMQTALLGTMFVGVALLTDCAYALLAGSLANALGRGNPGGVARRVEGGILIGLGLVTAAVGTRTAR